MNTIYKECLARGIDRICHFTQSRNLAHIFDSEPNGLHSTKTLTEHDMPHNPTDAVRRDGRPEMICCSVQYPNTYYFTKARNDERLFQDWAVLLIACSYLWHPDTLFYPCNSALNSGTNWQQGIQGFRALFANTSPGINFIRRSSHLRSAPTNIQAEVQLKGPIPYESINGIIVKTSKQAQREVLRLKLQGIAVDKPIYISHELFERQKLAQMIQQGRKPVKTLYRPE